MVYSPVPCRWAVLGQLVHMRLETLVAVMKHYTTPTQRVYCYLMHNLHQVMNEHEHTLTLHQSVSGADMSTCIVRHF